MKLETEMQVQGFYKDSKNKLKAQKHSCASCELYKNAKTYKMQPYGSYNRGIINVGEAPGCVSGNTLIEVAYRNKVKYPNGIPIKDLEGMKGFYVYSFDIHKNELTLGKVNKVWNTGRKKVYRVIYEWWYAKGNESVKVRNSLKTTANHKFLLKQNTGHKSDPFKGKKENRKYLSIDDGLSVGHGLQPFHRNIVKSGYGHMGTFSNKMKREGRFLLFKKIGRFLSEEEQCHHIDENKLNDEWNNLKLLNVDEHSKEHSITRENPMYNEKHKKKHTEVLQSFSYKKKMSNSMKEYLSDSENYKKRIESIHKQKHKTQKTVKDKFKNDPVYYYNYLLGRQKCTTMTNERVKELFRKKFPNNNFPPIDNHKIISIEYVGVEAVYDMEVENYHNFATHGIFVHNSQEDEEGRHWQGKVGRILQRTYRRLGVNLFEDCLNVNSVNCWPGKGNKKPTAKQIACCRNVMVENALYKNQPELIMLFGSSALQSFLGHRWAGKSDSLGGITRWRGFVIPDREFKTWVAPVFHPSYIARMDEEIETLWIEDIERALEVSKNPLPKYKEPEIEVINDLERLYEIESDLTAFDYETTGLKPQASGHRIISCAIADTQDHVFAFEMPKKRKDQKPFLDYLENPNIGKVAANMKYEHIWSQVRLKTQVKGWDFDTMLAGHVLDNRPRISGLKFQTYINFGIIDYSSKVDKYLHAGDSGNDKNKIEELVSTEEGLNDLLTYNAYDSIYELRLANMQIQEMNYNFLPF